METVEYHNVNDSKSGYHLILLYSISSYPECVIEVIKSLHHLTNVLSSITPLPLQDFDLLLLHYIDFFK